MLSSSSPALTDKKTPFQLLWFFTKGKQQDAYCEPGKSSFFFKSIYILAQLRVVMWSQKWSQLVAIGYKQISGFLIKQ